MHPISKKKNSLRLPNTFLTKSKGNSLKKVQAKTKVAWREGGKT